MYFDQLYYLYETIEMFEPALIVVLGKYRPCFLLEHVKCTSPCCGDIYMSLLHHFADVPKLAVSQITHCKQVGYFHR